jgi:ribosomal protein S18 acetylase RimI-like enzyme
MIRAVHSPTLTLRAITPSDADILAALHASSWRTAYRGILSDDYLAGAVDADRLAAWHARCAAMTASEFGVLAMRDGQPVGFVFVVADADATYGHLIDNLHVDGAARSGGIGPQLLDAAAQRLAERSADFRAHLWVYDANIRARAFYARIGGREVERTTKLSPEGETLPTVRVAWDDAQVWRRRA